MDPVTIAVGIDVGQRVDPTAIVVAEVRPRDDTATFTIRHLERLPINTSYPAVATRTATVMHNLLYHLRRPRYSDDGALETNGWDFKITVYVCIDATGVGRPVVELIAAALEDETFARFEADIRVEAATFTHGDRLTWVDGERRVGKAHLVSRLQALLQTDRIALPRTAEARALADELLVYEIRVSENANDTYGAFKVGTHDDLATALGLAVIDDRQRGGSGSIDWFALEQVI